MTQGRLSKELRTRQPGIRRIRNLTQTGHSYQAFGQREQLSGSPGEVKSSARLAWRELAQRAGQEAAVGIGGEPGEGVEQIIFIA